MPDLTSDLARFWAKVDKTETCWLWTASKMTGGYGAFTSLVLRTKIAHRFAYLALVGPIPEGFELDHTCHVRHCVRPDHLRPVTKGQNQQNRAGVSSNNTTGHRGVRRTKSGRWYAVVQMDGRSYSAGRTFGTVEEAAAAATELRTLLMTHNDVDQTEAS